MLVHMPSKLGLCLESGKVAAVWQECSTVARPHLSLYLITVWWNTKMWSLLCQCLCIGSNDTCFGQQRTVPKDLAESVSVECVFKDSQMLFAFANMQPAGQKTKRITVSFQLRPLPCSPNSQTPELYRSSLQMPPACIHTLYNFR